MSVRAHPVNSQRRWKLKPPSPRASQLALEADLSILQAQLILNRGISDPLAARRFVTPRLADLADPMLFKDMDRALKLILNAMETGRRIAVYGDYDADGLTATALLVNFFKDLGVPVIHWVPNRFRDGYGLNAAGVEKLAAEGTGLIVTVDCGISGEREIALAGRLGLEVVVTDHHQVPADFNSLCPVINPLQKGCGFPCKHLSGVGIAFFLAVAVRGALRERGRFGKDRPEPDLRSYLDLVALGTVADRVPLVGQNRILVRNGIRVMAGSRWPGIKALMEISGVRAAQISSEDLAFRLGPRLNAPGRISDPEICIEVLCTEEKDAAVRMARKIGAANTERRQIEQSILEQIEGMFAASGGVGEARSLVVSGEGWSQGVLGIVASRLVEKYHRPALVFTTKDGHAIGSGRSIHGFNLYEALTRMGGLFEAFGGHAHAAGIRMKAENLDRLKQDLEDIAGKTLSETEMAPTVQVDAQVSLRAVGVDMVKQISSLAPFGEGNPDPRFLARSVRVLGAKVVGGRHLKLKLTQGEKTMEAIGFGMGERYPLPDETVDMVFVPETNHWQGRERIQLRIIDLEKSDRMSRLILEDPGGQLDVLRAEYE